MTEALSKEDAGGKPPKSKENVRERGRSAGVSGDEDRENAGRALPAQVVATLVVTTVTVIATVIATAATAAMVAST